MIVGLFRRRSEDEVFIGGEEAPRLEKKRRHMRARVIMALTLLLLTVVDWYIASGLATTNTALWYWILSVMLTIHIGWILIAIAVLAP
ncbi:MAG: hypothetical protein QXT81_03080 [Candidatus Bathyarchaeia archaeon]